MCFDHRDGRLTWQQGTVWNEPDPTHGTNPQCSASPVTDGEQVIAWFGSAGLVCYDLQGNLLWKRDLGRQRHIWGYGPIPTELKMPGGCSPCVSIAHCVRFSIP